MNGFRRKKKPATAGVEILGVAVCTGFDPQCRKPGSEPERIAKGAKELRARLDEMASLGDKLIAAKEVAKIATEKANNLAKELHRMNDEVRKATKAVQMYEAKLREYNEEFKKLGIKI